MLIFSWLIKTVPVSPESPAYAEKKTKKDIKTYTKKTKQKKTWKRNKTKQNKTAKNLNQNKQKSKIKLSKETNA